MTVRHLSTEKNLGSLSTFQRSVGWLGFQIPLYLLSFLFVLRSPTNQPPVTLSMVIFLKSIFKIVKTSFGSYSVTLSAWGPDVCVPLTSCKVSELGVWRTHECSVSFSFCVTPVPSDLHPNTLPFRRDTLPESRVGCRKKDGKDTLSSDFDYLSPLFWDDGYPVPTYELLRPTSLVPFWESFPSLCMTRVWMSVFVPS